MQRTGDGQLWREFGPAARPEGLLRDRPHVDSLVVTDGGDMTCVIAGRWVWSSRHPVLVQATVGDRPAGGVWIPPVGADYLAVPSERPFGLWLVRASDAGVPTPLSGLPAEAGRYAMGQVVFSPSGTTACLRGRSGLVSRWRLPTGEVLPPLQGPGADDYSEFYWHADAVSPDGEVYAVGARGLLHLLTPRWSAPLPVPADTAVGALAFSPDGRTLAAAGRTGTLGELPPNRRVWLNGPYGGAPLQFWDVPTRSLRAAFDLGVGPVHSLAFAPDGLTLAAGGDAGQVVVSDVD